MLEEFETVSSVGMEGSSEGGLDILQNLNNVDLTKVDRTFPVISDARVLATIEKFETKVNKAKTGHNLIIHLKTKQECRTEDGKHLKPGFPIQDLISLVQVENYNPLERLADIQLATHGKQMQGFRFEDYIGRDVVLALKIDDDETYGRRHRVSRYVKKAATATL